MNAVRSWPQAGVFARVFTVDAVTRSAYQVGKTPVLPVFAASLGAGDAMIGLVASISVATGLFLKPLVGWAADRWGYRECIVAALVVGTLLPFAYVAVSTPGQLAAIRVLHGTTTALLGPATIALVLSLSDHRIAERIGWFGVARGVGYVVGPAAGGALLAWVPPAEIYAIVGAVTAFALFIALGLPTTVRQSRPAAWPDLRAALGRTLRLPTVWAVGAYEAVMFAGLYALKVFLPVYALSLGVSLLGVGGLLAIQEACHLVARPFSGRLADRVGFRPGMMAGLGLVGAALCAVAVVPGWALVLPFVLLGLGQSMVEPAAVSLVARQVGPAHRSAAVGQLGALRNAGKLAGPIAGGFLVAAIGFLPSLALLGGGVGVAALMLGLRR